MNRDSNSASENDDLAKQRAAAQEDARARSTAAATRRAEAAKIEGQGSRRSPWEFAPDSARGFWYEFFGERMMLFLGLGALWLVVSSIFWLAEALRWPLFYLIRSLDIATGARVVRSAPWLLWMVWGGIFGGCLGYWLVAPIYGDRENRSFCPYSPWLCPAHCCGLSCAEGLSKRFSGRGNQRVDRKGIYFECFEIFNTARNVIKLVT